ncbi:MAG: erythromycin esterase family protein [Lewinellaceae bacterium]|nr:erythromycin esterase family protein [Lewinellaceae bacterium]
MNCLFRILIATAIIHSTLAVAAQQPLNLDFERISPEGPARPWGWQYFFRAPHAKAVMDSTVAHSGKYSYRISGEAQQEPVSPHTLGYWIDPWGLKGKQVELTGWISRENLEGQARVTLETWGEEGKINADTMNFPPTSERPADALWMPFSLNIPVDSAAYTLSLTIGLIGSGAAWFDALTLSAGRRQMAEVPVAPQFTSAQMEWLAQQAAPLKQTDPTPEGKQPDYSDLDAFRRITGGAQLIALGESTHGTSEFFSIKHRLLEYAVKEMGVTVFAIEANQLAVEAVNRYVLNGEGDARTAMKVMFKVWNTEEMLALIEWMRAYNLENPQNKVEFVGFDMQDPQLPIDSLLAFLPDYAPELLAAIDSLLGPYREAWREQYYPTAPDSIREGWIDNTRLAWELVSARKADWLRQASNPAEKNRVEWALQNARVALQAAHSAYYTFDQGTRDSAMAENIGWLLSRRPPGTRMIIWAHDAHISRGKGPDPLYNYFQGGSMGAHLARQYGDSYRAFGLSTYDGAYSATLSYQDNTMVPVEAFPSPEGSLDEALHRLAAEEEAPGLIIDLRAGRDQPWLLYPRPVRFIGYMASDYGYEAKMAIPYQFDGLIFINRTSHSRLVD